MFLSSGPPPPPELVQNLYTDNDNGHARHLGTVNMHGANTIIIIRVGVVDTSTSANVLPDYCNATCANVRQFVYL